MHGIRMVVMYVYWRACLKEFPVSQHKQTTLPQVMLLELLPMRLKSCVTSSPNGSCM